MTTTRTTPRPATRGAQTERTRAAILDAAQRVFVDKGYRATSLRDVAAAAGISHPGLQRHFATKDTLLLALLESFTRGGEDLVLSQLQANGPGTFTYADLARNNASMPGYLELYAALTGEASAASHPAHQLMRERYADLIAGSTQMATQAVIRGTISPDRDPRGEMIRLIAAWDGLQLLSLYLPGSVDIEGALQLHQQQQGRPVGWRAEGDVPTTASAPFPPLPRPGDPSAEADLGYRPGRDRRAQIITDATELFATEGYGDTSLRDIADAVGVSKSTLLHHYRSKEELLRAVLVERDRTIAFHTDPTADRAAVELRNLVAGANERTLAEPGLAEVYAVLSGEAVPATHPAHAYFAERYRLYIDHLTALLRAAQQDGDLPAHRDPEHEAAWLMALWDGLQLQWLYDRENVDVAAHLTAHLDDVLS